MVNMSWWRVFNKKLMLL